jgi:hypothetical protein
MEDRISVPRVLLATLVDPDSIEYIDGEYGVCNFCGVARYQEAPHAPACPIRQGQELLAAAEKPPVKTKHDGICWLCSKPIRHDQCLQMTNKGNVHLDCWTAFKSG